MRRSLRSRLLAIVLAGIIILTAINLLIETWGLSRVRDRAIGDSAAAQQREAEQFLQKLAQTRAETTGQTINTVQKTAAVVREYLDQTLATGQPGAAPNWQILAGGRRYAQGKTTLVLPAGAGQSAIDEAANSQSLDALLPRLSRTLPEIARISYLTPRGVLRTYPPLEPARLPAEWSPQADLAYQAAAQALRGAIVWTPIHPALDRSDQVISAAAPIYQRDQLQGVVVIDVSMARLTSYLERISVAQTGFVFLIDSRGRLLAAPAVGQIQLISRVMAPEEVGTVALDTSAIGTEIANMRAGGSSVAEIGIGSRQFVLTYAPIPALKWSLGLLAPLDEITVGTSATAGKIIGIANETRRLGLLVSLGAVVLMGLAIGIGMRRWLAQPLANLTSATESIAAGSLGRIAIGRQDEIGRLAAAFNTMTAALEASRAELTVTNQQLEQKVQERTADLDMAVSKMEQMLATQQDLLRALREVSTPVIPVIEGVLAMPLVGQIDDQRAQNMTRALLERIEREGARTVLLDITGVSAIDTQVAQALLRAVGACRLLGAEVVLVGVAPEVAQTIVTLGIDLGSLRTAADLRSAIERIAASRAGDRPGPHPRARRGADSTVAGSSRKNP